LSQCFEGYIKTDDAADKQWASSSQKSGRSSVVDLRFVLTVYKPRVLVFSICVAYTFMNCWSVHFVTCFFLAFEWRWKILCERITLSFSRYDSPEQPSWCLVCGAGWKVSRAGREGGGAKCDTTSNELKMKSVLSRSARTQSSV